MPLVEVRRCFAALFLGISRLRRVCKLRGPQQSSRGLRGCLSVLRGPNAPTSPLWLPVCVQSLGKAAAYSNIIATCTPAVVALVTTLVANVSSAIAPHLPPDALSQLQQQQQQQQQPSPDPQQQQQQQLWRCQQLIEASTAAAVRMAAVGGSSDAAGSSSRGEGAADGGASPGAAAGAAAAARPFEHGEDDVKAAFKLVRRLLDVMRDIRDRCRCVCVCVCVCVRAWVCIEAAMELLLCASARLAAALCLAASRAGTPACGFLHLPLRRTTPPLPCHHHRLNSQQLPAVVGVCAAAVAALQDAACQLLTASVAAAAFMQAALIIPAHLSTDAFVHKVRCRGVVMAVGATAVPPPARCAWAHHCGLCVPTPVCAHHTHTHTPHTHTHTHTHTHARVRAHAGQQRRAARDHDVALLPRAGAQDMQGR
jgi:hypothetical protein